MQRTCRIMQNGAGFMQSSKKGNRPTHLSGNINPEGNETVFKVITPGDETITQKKMQQASQMK